MPNFWRNIFQDTEGKENGKRTLPACYVSSGLVGWGDEPRERANAFEMGNNIHQKIT